VATEAKRKESKKTFDGLLLRFVVVVVDVVAAAAAAVQVQI